MPEPLGEFVACPVERVLGVDSRKTGDLDRGEQDIAQLVLDGVFILEVDGLAELRSLLAELCQRVADIFAVESGLGGL